MKKIFIILLVFTCQSLYAQPFVNWNTVGGNSLRNGRSDVNGPAYEHEVRYRSQSLPTIWGNQIFIEGARLVTTRYTSLNPLRAPLACHNAINGDTIWTRNYAENGVMIVMGFRDGQIYARNFQQQGFDTIYALNPENGNVIWKSRHTVERGIIWTAAFTEGGDLIVPGSGTKSVMRINHLNGDTVWTRYRIIPNTGAECMCVKGNTVYTFEGGITTPKRLVAIDANTGAIKYYSPTLPGDGDQEIPFSISPNGKIYVVRDGGDLFALRDTGSEIAIVWSATLPGAVGTYSQFGVRNDSDLVIGAGKKVYRIRHTSGELIDSTEELISSGTLNARIAVDAFNDYIYVGNGASNPSEGKYFSIDRDMNIQWSDPVPYNYYSGPALAYAQGMMGLFYCGAGTEIICIADFASVVENSNNLPSGISLFDNYPNPFNPSTTVRFELSQAEKIKVSIYDVLGNFLETLYEGRLREGMHEFDWSPSSLSSGTYFSRIETESGTAVRKLMLIR